MTEDLSGALAEGLLVACLRGYAHGHVRSDSGGSDRHRVGKGFPFASVRISSGPEVAAICARDRSRAERVAADHDIGQVFTDYRRD